MQCEQTLVTYKYGIIRKKYLHIRTPREISKKKFKLFKAIFGKKCTYKDEGNIFKNTHFLKALYCSGFLQIGSHLKTRRCMCYSGVMIQQ